MSKVVNLGRERKRRARAAARRKADANAVAHGRTKADKRAAREAQARLSSTLDGARRTADDRSAPEDRERGAADSEAPT